MADGYPTQNFFVGGRHARDFHTALLGVQQRLEHCPVHRAGDGHDDVGNGLLLTDIQQAVIAADDRDPFHL